MRQPRGTFNPEDYLPSKRKGLPKGTTDVVLERLFPTQRSRVPTDEERRQEVYDILVTVGVLNGGLYEGLHDAGHDEAAQAEEAGQAQDAEREAAIN